MVPGRGKCSCVPLIELTGSSIRKDFPEDRNRRVLEAGPWPPSSCSLVLEAMVNCLGGRWFPKATPGSLPFLPPSENSGEQCGPCPLSPPGGRAVLLPPVHLNTQKSFCILNEYPQRKPARECGVLEKLALEILVAGFTRVGYQLRFLERNRVDSWEGMGPMRTGCEAGE